MSADAAASALIASLSVKHSLDGELQAAIEEENHRKNVNDAKMFAVEQRLPTYDQFHQNVLGADLKPMKQQEDGGKGESFMEGLRTKQPVFYRHDHFVTEEGVQGAAQPTPLAPLRPPRNSTEFSRTWRQSRSAGALEGWRYVEVVSAGGGAALWSKIFSTGVDAAQFSQLVETLRSGWGGGRSGTVDRAGEGVATMAAASAAAPLLAAAAAPRFELVLQLLSAAERAALGEVIGAVLEAGEVGSEDDAAALQEVRGKLGGGGGGDAEGEDDDDDDDGGDLTMLV